MTWNWTAFGYLLLMYFPAILVHELGHLMAGWLLGGQGAEIHFGRPGGGELRLPLGPVLLRLRLDAFLWRAPCAVMTRLPVRHSRQSVIFAVGGPVASALLLALTWPGDLAALTPGRIQTWQTALAFHALWGLILPLIPIRYPSGLPSDGLQILKGINRASSH